MSALRSRPVHVGKGTSYRRLFGLSQGCTLFAAAALAACIAVPDIVAAKARELVTRADNALFADGDDPAFDEVEAVRTTGEVVDEQIPEESYAMFLSPVRRYGASSESIVTLSEIVDVERYYPRIWLSALSPIGRMNWSEQIELSQGAQELRQAGASQGPIVFGSVPIQTTSRAIISKTSEGLRDIDDAFAECARNGSEDRCEEHVPDGWRSVLKQARGLPAIVQARRVNSEVNSRIAYRPDDEDKHQGDRWAPARETISRKSGDCEDFAILKMWLLARLGFAPNDMFVVVVRAEHLATQHAVLAVRIGDETYILDNRVDRVAPAVAASTYSPVFSVNAIAAWLHGFPRGEAITAATEFKASPAGR